MNQAFINRHYEYKPKLSRVIPKPLVSSLIMGVITYGAYKLLAAVVGESSYGRMALCMLVSIVIGVAVYLVAAVQTRAITYDDMECRSAVNSTEAGKMPMPFLPSDSP